MFFWKVPPYITCISWSNIKMDMSFAVVCSSNMNRSMEAHVMLAKRGLKVKSFGTGDKIRLPGVTPSQAASYDFGTVSYRDILNDLTITNEEFYRKSGVLGMLMRNYRLKPYPEKFQLSTEKFDIIITCEQRVYNQVIKWFALRDSEYEQPAFVINIDIKDNFLEAKMGGFMISDLAVKISLSKDLGNELDQILKDFSEHSNKTVTSCVVFY